MWDFQQHKNKYCHPTSLNFTGPQATSDTPQNIQFNHIMLCKIRYELKRSKTWDMEWHWLKDKEVIEQLRVYWDKGMKNNTGYFTKHHPPIHHCQMQPRYIHTLNSARKIPHNIRLCEGVLNWVPFTKSWIRNNPLKLIRVETQYMTQRNVRQPDG